MKRKSSIFAILILIIALGGVFANFFTDAGMLMNTWMAIFPVFFIVIFLIIFLTIVKRGTSDTLDNSRHHDQPYYSQTKTTNECSKCHQPIDKVFEYCPYCGASQKNTIICQYCGHENPKTNALCEKCNGFID